MAGLIVRKEDGSILFDTQKITYGLVKSGYMEHQGMYPRFVCVSNACKKDPSWGGNWEERGNYNDQVFGFSVANVTAPIVFIVGHGVFAGTSKAGNVTTFNYSDASAGTKFYCFDLMKDGGAGPALRTYKEDGTLTFNSRQSPLNIVAAVRAPDPGPRQGVWHALVYTGGYNERYNGTLTPYGRTSYASVRSSVDIPLVGMGEVAAFLPWSRGVGCAFSTFTEFNYPVGVSVTESCFGGNSKITFSCAISRTTMGDLSPTSVPMTICFRDIPVDRFPTALVIKTANLPFPFTFN